jgi:hypothetical protein
MVVICEPRLLEVVRDPFGAVDVMVVNRSGGPCGFLTEAIRHLTSHASERTSAKYLRSSIRMFDAALQLAGENAHASGPFEEPELVQILWKDLLKALGATIRWQARSKHYSVTVPPDLFDRVKSGLYGAFLVYEVLRERKLYAHRNPLATTSPQKGGFGKAPVRSLFCLNDDQPHRRPAEQPIPVELIRRAGRTAKRPWPPAVACLFDVMAEGLARLSEQIALTVADWWTGSRFATAIDTPNKGDDGQRTKTQIVTAELAAQLRHYFDYDRIDPTGRKLRDYERLALAGDLTLLREAPLFPNKRGGFFSQSGVADYYFRPAMLDAGLKRATSHCLRHAGVNDFLSWVAGLECGAEEKDQLRRSFGRYMGWKWPEAMLDHYGMPTRQREAIDTATRFLVHREERLRSVASMADAAPYAASFVETGPACTDDDLERMFRNAL